jgi:REP element-mobilizing transposase RayT
MPRQARLDAPGTLHHVILRGIERRRIVDDRADQEAFIERMGQSALETGIMIYAWSLLPNHAHILLKSGQAGLSHYMRRFLTGYAITYNRRHNRYGHLFQNRFKSIVCDEDVYFKELVRYIHLNPLRAKLVKDLRELDRYPLSGHRCLMGKRDYEWQDRKYVISWFGKRDKEARKAYRDYMREGINQGNRPELVGGGLIRSLGGWSVVSSLRKDKEKLLTDERVLGSGEFAEKIIREADEKVIYQFSRTSLQLKVRGLIEEVCAREGVAVHELRSGSRRGKLPSLRSAIVIRLVKDYGIPLAEIGRQVGISTSAVSKIMSRNEFN